MPGLNDALAEIDALGPEEKVVYTNIAEKHSVSRTTLSRVHRGVQVPRSIETRNNQKLSNQQELDLVEYIEKLTENKLPPTRHMVQNFASSVVSQPG